MTIPTRVRALALPLALALALTGGPLHAAEAPAPLPEAAAQRITADPHGDLYDAMQGGIDNERVLDNLIESIIAEMFRLVPELELLEAEKPGLMAGMAAAFRPVLADYSARVKETYRPRMIALFKEELSAEDAEQLSAFYRSDLGRKLLTGLSNNYTGARTMRSAIENPKADIPAETITNDVKSATFKAYLGLSVADRKAVDALATDIPAFGKLNKLQPQINALRHEMENSPMLPEEDARLQSSIDAALQEYLDNPAEK
ncbi:DUF2059 domain-containing protein [Altererythrobacter sp. CC-YST694]|uniref:DUF2059 domain-containing protein n=1 Tax=Altererythrobacter sp. CC-YST694 TaxID=2755038 RepID=UPI001D018907|nr:DUF2059 domain-containing protein [Altererythrobacter sp. CC-YST694]MCB5426085.1 DUF2059 domain-containing protein [Altererythrobacter sp. CC-YST694]